MSTKLKFVLVELFEGPDIATVQDAVNAFIAAANDAFQLVSTDFRYADGAANPYLVMLTYTGV